MTAREPADRVTLNQPGNWSGPDHALGQVDEIVVHDAMVHLEMSGDSDGSLTVNSLHRQLFVRLHARPTSRAQRRQVLAHSSGRLRDHLAALIPQRWGGRSLWFIPVWRRPAAALAGWWADRRAAGAVLVVELKEDEQDGTEPEKVGGPRDVA